MTKEDSRKMHRFRNLFTAAAVVVAAAGHSDYAVTQEGLGLFNVLVDDSNTTWSRPLKVKYESYSFAYNYGSNAVTRLGGHQDYYWIGDFTRSGDRVDKETARKIMKDKGWSNYQPPETVRLIPFTPAPPTPTPEPRESIYAGELADQTLPMDERVAKQLDLFIERQRALSDELNFASHMKQVSPEDGKKKRLEVLERQLRILRQNYDLTDNRLEKAVQALEHQIDVVKEKGRFSFEVI